MKYPEQEVFEMYKKVVLSIEIVDDGYVQKNR